MHGQQCATAGLEVMLSVSKMGFRTCVNGYSTGGIAEINRVHERASVLECEFQQFSAFPRAQSKFQIVHDAVSELFWTAVKLQTDSRKDWDALQARTQAGPPGSERRILALMYSLDTVNTVNWLQAGYTAMSRNPLEAYS